MYRFIAERFAALVATIVAISIIIFLAVRFLPGSILDLFFAGDNTQRTGAQVTVRHDGDVVAATPDQTAGEAMTAELVALHHVQLYTAETLRCALGLRKSTLAREIRLGRLRVAKRAGRHFLFGKWVIQWLQEGEVCRKRGGEVGGVSGA